MLLIMALSGSSCVIQNATPSPTPFPSNRKVISDTLALQEKWRVKSGTIVEDTLHWTKNGLVYADYTQQLVLLDNQNGQTLWQTEYSQFYSATSLVADEDNVYLTEERHIHTYSLLNGQQLWETKVKGTHRGHYLYLGNGLLYEYESPARDGNIVRRFDPKTGEKLETEILPVNELFIQALLENIYLGSADKQLWAVERGTNEILWKLPRRWVDVKTPPVMVDDYLILTNDWVLLVLNPETGEVLWQQPDIESNPIVLDNVVYVIATDGSIRAYNLTDGQEVGRIQMAPPVTIASRYSYALNANPRDKMIYAYYGDSKEIIVFAK